MIHFSTLKNSSRSRRVSWYFSNSFYVSRAAWSNSSQTARYDASLNFICRFKLQVFRNGWCLQTGQWRTIPASRHHSDDSMTNKRHLDHNQLRSEGKKYLVGSGVFISQRYFNLLNGFQTDMEHVSTLLEGEVLTQTRKWWCRKLSCSRSDFFTNHKLTSNKFEIMTSYFQLKIVVACKCINYISLYVSNNIVW